MIFMLTVPWQSLTNTPHAVSWPVRYNVAGFPGNINVECNIELQSEVIKSRRRYVVFDTPDDVRADLFFLRCHLSVL